PGVEPMALSVEVLDPRAGGLGRFSVLAPVRLVDIREDRAEAGDRRGLSPVGTGHEEETLGDPAAHGGEQAQGAEGGAVVGGGRIVEEYGKARRGSLRKPDPGRRELGAA